MKTFFSGLVILLLVVGFSSCQKEVDGKLTDNPTSQKLSKIILVDTTLTSPKDTLRIDGYKYDNSGRLIYYYSMLDNIGGILDTAFKTWFFYNGNTTLPFKFIYNELNSGVMYDTDTIF